jgi:hypothetical protein
MLQRMALDRWSQVTIYPKPSCCSIDLPHEGAYHVCKALPELLAKTPNRYGRAEFMRMI